jgi:ATP/ADP translocase
LTLTFATMTMELVAAAATAAAPSVLSSALLIGRSGATLLAVAGATSLVPPLVTTIRGGGAKIVSKKAKTPAEADKEVSHKSAKQGQLISQEGKSVLWMATGMAFHYLGYSLARSITVALFTSSVTGYPGSPGAFPFAMAFVSPVSLLLLMGYGGILERDGPRIALRKSTLFCAAIMTLAAVATEVTEMTQAVFFGIPAMKFVTAPLFIFRESYVQLLTTQYWSFMASVLTPNQSARYFAPISGLTSISSAIGGMAVNKLVNKLRLSGALACTSLALVTSLFATSAAYSIADKGGFTPTDRTPKKKTPPLKGKNAGKVVSTSDHHSVGLIAKARALFARVPVLRALFLEILASQGLATLLNVCFVQSLGASITNDTERAGWVGNFYALINIITMFLQFGFLPFVIQWVEPKQLWRVIPLISLAFTTFQAMQEMPTLYIVSCSLLVMKVLEYSARRMLDEMVYVPLDFESRFVGKEIIGVFGYRFGKSMMSLLLSGITSAMGNFNLHQLSIFCDISALFWVKTAWTLSNLVPTRKEAQEAYTKSRSKQ